MWSDKPFHGGSLPAKTLVLTFDDGPGPGTAELAHYLAEEGISAAFFVVGKHVSEFRESIEVLSKLGHTVGNHSFHHFHLTNSHSSAAELVTEIETADEKLQGNSAIRDKQTYFRPPYGAWSPRLAWILRHEIRLRHYVGPVNWDIGGSDHRYWASGKTAEDGAAYYEREVRRRERQNGIVLFHDRNADRHLRPVENRTFKMVPLLIARLREQGFTFKPLEAIPDLQRAANKVLPSK